MSTETSLRERVAEEVRALLGRRKMSASELARQLSLTQKYVSRRLTGETAFDLDDLEKIAAIFGVDVADLLPRSAEGRLVVSAGENRRQTTGPNSSAPKWPGTKGHATRASHAPATRRTVRMSHTHA